MNQDRKALFVIFALSLFSILFLFWLIYFKTPLDPRLTYPSWIKHLATMNAVFNFCSAVCMVLGFLQIKKKNIEVHRHFMNSAFLFSACFLVSYILYHNFHGDTPFPGTGAIRPIYFFILISHVLLSIVALPLVLTTFYYARLDLREKHKKLARWTFPIWLYVSITGVVIYFILSAYLP